jgi:(1->4)-alpha-D-glucan 1-alpha-D-glucosylmutase
MFVIHCCLAARKSSPDVFLNGAYLPVKTHGKFADNILSFCRIHSGKWCLAVVPLFLSEIVSQEQLPIGDVWQDTRLELPNGAPSRWRDAFTGDEVSGDGSLEARSVFRDFPLGLLSAPETVQGQ